MAGDGTTTTRFGFREPGEQTVNEPGFIQALMDAVDASLPAKKYSATATPAVAGAGPVAGTGVAVSYDEPIASRRIRLTLTNFVVNIINADGEYGGTVLCTMPDRNLHVLGAELNLSCVLGAASGASDTGKLALGTVVAASTALGTTQGNIFPAASFTASSKAFTIANHSLAVTPAPVGMLDSATNYIYLNVAESGSELAADSTCTINGTVDIYFIELGNVTS